MGYNHDNKYYVRLEYLSNIRYILSYYPYD